MGKYKNPLIDESFFERAEKNYDEETEANYSEYKDVYFAFIDVLGFKRDFMDHSPKYKRVFEYYSQIMNATFTSNIQNGVLVYAGQTSDSLYFYTNRIDLLVRFMQIYAYFSVWAMEKDVFFRGGIAKGKLYISGKEYQFYGNSVINAYLLESEVAKMPRIMVDKFTYEDVLVEPYGKELVCEDKNSKRYYMLPFSYFKDGSDWDLNVPKDIFRMADIKKVRRKIENNIKRFEYEDSNYVKYAFLKNELQKVDVTKEEKKNGRK